MRKHALLILWWLRAIAVVLMPRPRFWFDPYLVVWDTILLAWAVVDAIEWLGAQLEADRRRVIVDQEIERVAMAILDKVIDWTSWSRYVYKAPLMFPPDAVTPRRIWIGGGA